MAKKNIESKECEECGKRIPYARIEALPDTTLCVGCAATLLPDPSKAVLDQIYDDLDLRDVISGDNS